MQWRLGLDVGTNSIGWVVLKLSNKALKPNGVGDMGVRIFPDGREPSQKDRVGDSLAVGRRQSRGMRRNRDRRQKRLRRCAKAMVRMGLLPKKESERKVVFQDVDPYQARYLAATENVDKKTLARALMHLCKRRGFLSNRKTDSCNGDKEKKEGSKAKTGDKDKKLTERMRVFERYLHERDITLGQYLCERLSCRIVEENGLETDQRVRFNGNDVWETIDDEERAVYPKRQMYVDEFQAIRKKQRNRHLNDRQWNELLDIICFQRPLLKQEVGICTFERGEERASKHLPVSHRFRIIQEVNNLSFTENGTTRILAQQQRNQLIALLEEQETTTFSAAKTKLGLSRSGYFNLEGSVGDKKRGELNGNKTACKMRKVFANHDHDWDALDSKTQNDYVQLLFDVETDGEFKQAVQNNGRALPTALIEDMLAVSFTSSYGRLSHVAMEKLIKPMSAEDDADEDSAGMLYWQAAHHVYGGHTDRDFDSGKLLDKLPYYGQVLPDAMTPVRKNGIVSPQEKEHGRIPNPTVHVALNQIKRVVNELIDIHGKPDEIHIELAREIKNSAKKCQEITQAINANTKENERRKKLIAAARGIDEDDVTGIEVIKCKLWEELANSDRAGDAGSLARVDVYTGRNISLVECLSDEVEIEHILPYKMTRDDSMANKTITFREVNRAKGKRVPYRYAIEDGEDAAQEMIERAARLPRNKRWRFHEDALDHYEKMITNKLTPAEKEKFDADREGGFIDRQLVDTQYISKTAARYLATLVGRDNVVPVNGRMTAILRRQWKLEESKAKGTDQERDDHRHHAIDALVVAMTNRAMIKSITAYTKKKQDLRGESKARLYVPQLDGKIRSQMQDIYDDINVSYKPDHRLNGKFYEETAYGFLPNDAPERVEGYNAVVRRKLTALKAASKRKKSEVEAIRNPQVRNAIIEALDTAQVKSKGKWEDKLAFLAKEGVLICGYRRYIRRVKILINVSTLEAIPSAPYKGYPPAERAFCDIWRIPVKKTKSNPDGFRYKGRFVTYAQAKHFENPKKPDRVFDAELFEELRRLRLIHPAAKHMMRLFKNDMVMVEDDKGDKYLMRVASFNTTRNKLVLQPHFQSKAGQEEKTIPDLMTPQQKEGKLTKMKKVLITPAGRLIL